MEKITRFVLISILFSACNILPISSPQSEITFTPNSPLITSASRPNAISATPSFTPSPPGTFPLVISGRVYDKTTDSPIAGALIRFEVLHSYFSNIYTGQPDKTVSDPQGEFKLPMIVHDTDTVNIVVEAKGYQTFEQRLDLLGDRNLDIGLVPA